jgi:hypothetical protein
MLVIYISTATRDYKYLSIIEESRTEEVKGNRSFMLLFAVSTK